MQREHAGPARAGGIELGEQLGQVERAPILVEAEMRVGVEDLGVCGTQAIHLCKERSEGIGIREEGVLMARTILLARLRKGTEGPPSPRLGDSPYRV